MWSRPGPAQHPGMWLRGRRWPAAGAAQPVPGSLRKRNPAGAVRTCPEPPQPRVFFFFFLNSCPIFIVCWQDYDLQWEGRKGGGSGLVESPILASLMTHRLLQRGSWRRWRSSEGLREPSVVWSTLGQRRDDGRTLLPTGLIEAPGPPGKVLLS